MPLLTLCSVREIPYELKWCFRPCLESLQRIDSVNSNLPIFLASIDVKANRKYTCISASSQKLIQALGIAIFQTSKVIYASGD